MIKMLACLALMSLPAPLVAQDHSMHGMPGMSGDAPTMSPQASPPSPDCPPEHAKMGHCSPAPAAAMDTPSAKAGTDQEAGNAAPPAPPNDMAAASFYDLRQMQAANRAMKQEHGGMALSTVMIDLLEAQVGKGADGFRWNGEAWTGGDIHRLVIKSEGEGSFGKRVDAAEVQALYSRAVDPYFNLQAGVRQDIGSGSRPTYAVIAVEGLAPYWFEVEASAFLSDKGNATARIEAYYDQRITQRLLLQPRIEVNMSAQRIAAQRLGSGLTSAEAGLRLRYEISRQFAPYVGLSWDHKAGATARYARADGEPARSVSLVLGIRSWF